MPISSHLRDPLGGLLEVNRLARRPDALEDLPAAIAKAIADGLGFQAAAISLFRPAWDDFEVAAVVGEEAASEELLKCALDPGRKRRNGSSRSPDEPLRLPLQHSDGHVLGILSLLGRDDESSDGSLELIDAAATLAAQALETAQAEAEAERDRRALEELLYVSSRLTESHSVDAILQSVCDAIRRVLGFRLVVVELADAPADRYRPQAAAGIDLAGVDLGLDAPIASLRSLFDPAFEIEGCYLLPRQEAIARVGAEPAFQSTQNGRGPLGWNRHWLLVPLYDRAG
jgi:GAF domain-containing protein